MNDSEYLYLKLNIKKLTGINLENYKPNQMIRRLDWYISRSKTPEVAQFCSSLETRPEEVDKLQDFLTINVSEFYRDSAQFGFLRNQIIPDLLKQKPNLNIWSAGCSHGEEPYSLAMILKEISPTDKHKITGTDIDKASLNAAAEGGPYRADELKNVPPALVAKYFDFDSSNYRVKNELKSLVEFRRHDLMQDRFSREFDMIICRNVVIYFSETAKNELNHRFYGALKENGVLFIGSTETILDARDFGFERVFPCFYRKIGRRQAPLMASGAPNYSGRSI